MSVARPAARRNARKRAGALAVELRHDINRLLATERLAAQQEAARHSHDSLRTREEASEVALASPLEVAPAAAVRARQTTARLQRRLRNTVVHLDEALKFGLEFDFPPDSDLRLKRGDARNGAILIRGSMAAALSAPPGSALRSAHLAQARRCAEELLATVRWIERRSAEVESSAPAAPWSATWAGRLLGLAAQLLPAEERREFIEDQCANLQWAESRRERARYLLGLLARMPEVGAAAVAARERDRGSAALE